jgi:hypothetical protein
MSSVYHPTDWMDLPRFVREVARGRDPQDCSYEIHAAITEKVASSPIFFIRNFLKTTTKDGDLVFQDPWLGQTLLDLCCESQRKRRIAQKVALIKCRQMGSTQHNLGRGFHRVMLPNMIGLLLVKDEDVASDIMERVGTFYNGLPAWMRPMKRIDNPKLLNLDNPRAEQRADRPGLNSKFICTVPSGMRGIRPNYFIWSEAAFYDNWKEVVEGPMSGMGASPAFCTILDTTPNGEDDYYYPLVMEALERNPKWVASWERYGAPTRQQVIDGILGEPDRPKDGWVPAFFPWHWHEEYCTQDEHPQGQLESLTDDEKKEIKQTLGKKDRYGGEEETELVQRYGVSLGRLAWRRWCIDNNTGGRDIYERLLTFRQEYATNYRSCFRKIGKSTFDLRGMDTLGRQICPPVLRGKIREREKDHALYVDQGFHSDWEELRVWATPQSDEDYVIGVDGSNDWQVPDSDSWVAQVLRRRDRKQVAVYEMKCPPSVVRENLRRLYLYYNRALLGIEMEGSAIAVARELFILGVTRQYRWKRMDVDPYKAVGMDYLGWETNVKTRPVMQNLLVEAIGNRDSEDRPDPSITLRDEKTYSQLAECTRDEWGKIANHSGGGHDDHAIALMIALAINQDVWEPQAIKKGKPPERQQNPLLEPFFGSRPVGHNRPAYESL